MLKMPAGTGSLKYEIQQKKPFPNVRHEAVLGLLITSDLVRRLASSVVEPAGITMQQYNVLRILRGAGAEPLPTLEIRSRMIEQTPGITRLLDKLEKGGWVTRNRSEDDRRQVLCSISVRGKKLLDDLDASIDAVPERLLADVPDHEEKVLVRVLDQIRATQFEKAQPRDDANSAA